MADSAGRPGHAAAEPAASRPAAPHDDAATRDELELALHCYEELGGGAGAGVRKALDFGQQRPAAASAPLEQRARRPASAATAASSTWRPLVRAIVMPPQAGSSRDAKRSRDVPAGPVPEWDVGEASTSNDSGGSEDEEDEGAGPRRRPFNSVLLPFEAPGQRQLMALPELNHRLRECAVTAPAQSLRAAVSPRETLSSGLRSLRLRSAGKPGKSAKAKAKATAKSPSEDVAEDQENAAPAAVAATAAAAALCKGSLSGDHVRGKLEAVAGDGGTTPLGPPRRQTLAAVDMNIHS